MCCFRYSPATKCDNQRVQDFLSHSLEGVGSILMSDSQALKAKSSLCISPPSSFTMSMPENEKDILRNLGAFSKPVSRASGSRPLPNLPLPHHSDLGFSSKSHSVHLQELFFNPWSQSPMLATVPEHPNYDSDFSMETIEDARPQSLLLSLQLSSKTSCPDSLMHMPLGRLPMSETVAIRTNASYEEARQAYNSSPAPIQALARSPAVTFDHASPALSMTTSLSRVSAARHLSPDPYAHSLPIRAPIDGTWRQALPPEILQLQSFGIKLNSLGSMTMVHVTSPYSREATIAADWFSNTFGGLCAAIVHTFEVTELIEIPVLVSPYIRVICE